jgi:hypothetical protein
LIEADGKLYLYHKRALSGNIDEDMIDEEIVDERGQIVSVNGFKKSNNIPNIGLSLSDFFDMYINQ